MNETTERMNEIKTKQVKRMNEGEIKDERIKMKSQRGE